jgi:hypothetical protein
MSGMADDRSEWERDPRLLLPRTQASGILVSLPVSTAGPEWVPGMPVRRALAICTVVTACAYSTADWCYACLRMPRPVNCMPTCAVRLALLARWTHLARTVRLMPYLDRNNGRNQRRSRKVVMLVLGWTVDSPEGPPPPGPRALMGFVTSAIGGDPEITNPAQRFKNKNKNKIKEGRAEEGVSRPPPGPRPRPGPRTTQHTYACTP